MKKSDLPLVLSMGLVAVALVVKGVVTAIGTPMKPYDWIIFAVWILILLVDVLLLANAISGRKRSEKLDQMTNEIEELHKEFVKRWEDELNAKQRTDIES